jgi:hypothetical protein
MPSERSRQFLNLTTDELKSALIENAYRKDNDSRRWFSRFKFASDAVNGNPYLALGQGLDLLNTCRTLDENAYKEIHKGGAFYWLGIASFLVNEYEMAAFFFDSSVSEDLRWGDDPILNPSPAMRFMRIDSDHPNQAARSLVEATQKGIERWIDVYNSRPDNSTKITTQVLRDRLFIPSINPEHKNWRSLTSAFISFCLEWDYRNLLFDIRINPGTFEPYYLHLFKGCLLFESLLKENPIRKPPHEQNTLGRVLTYLHKLLGIKPNLDFKDKQFSDVMYELDNSDESIEQSILLTGMTRNTLGHNLGWEAGLTKNQYQRLFQMVSSSCIHVVSNLYIIT